MYCLQKNFSKLIAATLVLLAVSVWSYWSTITDLLYEWPREDDYSAGQLVPLVAIFLVWRDILVRYKQTVIGVAWAVIQPIATMIVFTVVFGKLAKLPSKDAPYAVMTFAAILP